MRVGINPQKLEKKVDLDSNHRIIVVVYIPEMKGFYENSFEVFKLCVSSLITTVNDNARITIVNNGSCKEVFLFLNEYQLSGKIDTVIHHRTNIGKIDAQIGAARGVREKFITLTDSDILFKTGWQENVEQIFRFIKKVGSVSPIPVKDGIYYGTSTVLKEILLRKVKFKKEAIPSNFEDYNKYLNSINWDLETDKQMKWPVLYSNGIKAIVGSGHQVLTIDRDILFQKTPTNPSLTLVGNNSESNYVDTPIDKSGKMRLSTYHNYAFHMGNKLELWMIEEQSLNERAKNQKQILDGKRIDSNDLFNSKLKDKFYSLKKLIIKKVFSFFYN